MNNIHKLCTILGAAALIVNGCGNGDTGTADAGTGGTSGTTSGEDGGTNTTGTADSGGTGSTTGVDTSTHLFPLTVGNSWTFNIIKAGTVAGEKTQTVIGTTHSDAAGGQVFVLESAKPNDKSTVSHQARIGADTVRFQEEYFSGAVNKGKETYSPHKLRIFDDKIIVGQEREDSYSEQTFTASGQLKSEAAKNEVWVIAAIETITVAAGTFENAVKIERTSNVAASSKTYWFVPGVGKVKEISLGQTEELTSYHLAQ